MIYPAGLYLGEHGNYLALYNYHPDVYILAPENSGTNHIAHASYEYGRRTGAVDLYQLNHDSNYSKVAKIVTVIESKGRGYSIRKNTQRTQETGFTNSIQMKNAQRMHNVDWQILNLDPKIREDIIDPTLADILFFCKGVEAKKIRDTKTEIVDRIIPRTKVKYITPIRMLTPGKQEFVPSCILEANIDFGQGCVSSLIQGQNPSFDGENFIDYWISQWGECAYCYAQQRHKNFIKTLYKFDKQRLIEELKGGFILELESKKTLGRPVEVLRFGKRTESYSEFTRNSFIGTLEACTETGTRTIIPTKFLVYNKEISRLVKKTDSIILFSVTRRDEFEKGALAQGCGNEQRLERAIRYHEDGTNTIIYLGVANPLKLSKEDWRIIKLGKKRGIKVQVLPIRYKRKDVMRAMNEIEWDYAKDNPDLFRKEAGTYYHEGNQCIPRIDSMDAKLISMIGDNKGNVCMCHHDDKQTYCGGCGIRKGQITPTIKVEKIGYKKKRKQRKQTPPIEIVIHDN